MIGLTKNEVVVLSAIAALLLTGLAVKFYRAGHPASAKPVQPTTQ